MKTYKCKLCLKFNFVIILCFSFQIWTKRSRVTKHSREDNDARWRNFWTIYVSWNRHSVLAFDSTNYFCYEDNKFEPGP